MTPAPALTPVSFSWCLLRAESIPAVRVDRNAAAGFDCGPHSHGTLSSLKKLLGKCKASYLWLTVIVHAQSGAGFHFRSDSHIGFLLSSSIRHSRTQRAGLAVRIHGPASAGFDLGFDCHVALLES